MALITEAGIIRSTVCVHIEQKANRISIRMQLILMREATVTLF